MLVVGFCSCLIEGMAEEFALHEIFSDAQTNFFSHEEDDFPSKFPRSVQLLEVHMASVSRHVCVPPLRLYLYRQHLSRQAPCTCVTFVRHIAGKEQSE